VLEHFVNRHRAILHAASKGVPGRSGSKRLESQLAKIDSCSSVPRIRKDETSLCVQSAEFFANGYLCNGHRGNLFRSRVRANSSVVVMRDSEAAIACRSVVMFRLWYSHSAPWLANLLGEWSNASAFKMLISFS
jgi:hypothetical protein